jgi:hypothetical protein
MTPADNNLVSACFAVFKEQLPISENLLGIQNLEPGKHRQPETSEVAPGAEDK